MKSLLLTMFFFYASFASGQQKRLYIGNDDHTDYMWTADEAAYDSAFVKMLDYYLASIDSTKNEKPDFQTRFNCDGSYWLRAYEKYRSKAQFEKLINRIKSGHISSPQNLLVSCYGAQPAEAVLRGMYYAGSLERKYNLRFRMAAAMENNTIPLGLSSLWAGSGVKYSWKGIGGYGSQLSYAARANRPHQLYKYTGLDGSDVLVKWYNYNEKTSAGLGGYAECRMTMKYKNLDNDMDAMVQQLTAFCDSGKPNAKYPYSVAAAFGFGHDDLDSYVATPFTNAAKRNTDATKRVRVSNQQDFFEDVERTYRNLPAESVSYGNEWDLLCETMHETTAKVRRSVEQLRTAEALASVALLHQPSLMNGLNEKRALAWESLGMYWEHDWTADGPVARNKRAQWQIKIQQQFSDYVDTLYNRSLNALSTQIAASANPRFFIFNPLSWKRNDVADLEYDGSTEVAVFDVSANKQVLSQPVIKSGKKFLRVWAEEVPSVGYKVFEIRPASEVKSSGSVLAKGEYISNPFYRLRLTPSGVISEWYDILNNNKQLAADVEGKLINDLGTQNIRHGSKVVVENVGPVSATLKAVSPFPIPHVVRVTLYANSPRIDIEDSIKANYGDVKSWAFSFNLNKPVTRHEELGAILTVKKQKNGGDYANAIARYDWQTFNHFAAMNSNDVTITLSNRDCSFFKLGRSSIDSLWETSSQLNALAGGQIDAKVEDQGLLGIPNQFGQKDFSYHFALTANKGHFNAVQSMKFSLEHQNPLVTGMVSGIHQKLPSDLYSLITIENPNVILWSLKPAEEGIQSGLIARLWNVGNEAADASINWNNNIKAVWQTSHIETNEKALTPKNNIMQLAFKKQQINTYRVVMK